MVFLFWVIIVRRMRFLKIPLYLLSFSALIYFPDTLFPYIFPKTVFIRLMLSIFWALLVAVLILKKDGFLDFRSFSRRNHILLVLSLFLFLVTISVFFAQNNFRAFWGDVNRGEGLVGLLYFYSFFVGATLVFLEKDWRIFFSLTALASILLFLFQIFSSHSGSLLGNPNFLSAFYLFSIFSALILLSFRKDSGYFQKNFKEFAKISGIILVALIGVIGIFLAGTRGTILGLVLGIISALIFLVRYLGRIGYLLIFSIFLFLTVFYFSRSNPFWQQIPGLDNLAGTNLEDPTFRTRIFAAKSSFAAMNPFEEGMIKFLFGWGQDNFISAFSKYYHPHFFRYENTWFDRAHNKLLDVFVMNGVLGLAAYLSIWFFVFRKIFEKKNKFEAASLLFFAVSYFSQNLFSFETPATYLALFSFFAFVAKEKEIAFYNNSILSKNRKLLLLIVFASAIYFAIIFAITFIAFVQSVRLVNSLETKQAEVILKSFDSWSKPYTFSQGELRREMLLKVLSRQDLSHPTIQKIFNLSLSLARESAEFERTDPQVFIPVAAAYEFISDLESAEKYRKKALELAPKRQDLLYSLALVYARQGRFSEATELAEKLLSLDPEAPRSKIYFAVISALTKTKSFSEVSSMIFELLDGERKFTPIGEDITIISNLFEFYLAEFYNMRDSEKFLEVMESFKNFALKYNPSRAVELQLGIEAFKEKGWKAIQLE